MAISYTHVYDLLFGVGTAAGGIMLVVVGAGLLHPISDPLERELKSRDLEWIWLLLMWAYRVSRKCICPKG
jgi:hypothetical protein